MSDFTEHIGKRIRLYRKTQHLTQQEFADQLHRSKSSISKYEKGEIAIDVDTLQEIADVLHVSLRQLTDLPSKNAPAYDNSLENFFGGANRLYVYYLNINSPRIVKGVLEIEQTEDEEYTSIFYTNLESYENLHQCKHLYYGDVHYSDYYVNMVMKNQGNHAERIYMNIGNPLHNRANQALGMLCGISGKYLVPIALKILVSTVPIPEDEDLRGILLFTKEDYQTIKRTYCFSISRMP